MISPRAACALLAAVIGALSACDNAPVRNNRSVTQAPGRTALLLQPDWRGAESNARSFNEVKALFADEGLGSDRLRVVPVSVDLHGRQRAAVQQELLAAVARESPGVLLTETMGAARLAVEAGVQVPIVFSGTADAKRLCLAQSLRRPGGNVTGSTSHMAREAKILEILRDAYPKVRHVRVIAHGFVTVNEPDCKLSPDALSHARSEQDRDCVAENSVEPGSRIGFILDAEAYANAARVLGLSIDFESVCDRADFVQAVRDRSIGEGLGVVVADHLLMRSEMSAVVKALVDAETPAIFDGRNYAVAGGVLAVSVASGRAAMQDAVELATLVIKGIAPGEIPIDTPDSIDIVVNVGVAGRHPALRPSVALLRRADEFVR